ncbi:LLM class flavin-dependent oxidoreductase [Cytobacillus oceanisediminis]|uniref:LLM class flavin-dependent oxidoreductase n=1 Tax=Bacillaceae TaxID=186817 RepID=UPI0013D3EB5A|nr:MULTISPECIES: LLM class flavin-dependent oxidoreductase [Bacillaceae]MBU8729825.1 LLM class flavin-dependent oxidoreductase [Cytobacillus oceanisediminis]MCM3243056.1 LLM class flavin-dependent oxidoreductase [Cytobacillus oceanisediminis]
MSKHANKLNEIPFSVLDLSPITAGSTPADSFRNTLELAQLAEKLDYNRFWLAEHHNMPFIASSATSVVMSHVAAGTSKIRIGSGGIMLPNHAPLVIAEQFGTLESLYPGRIDLGLGRAPGTDQGTARALRRDLGSTGDDFPEQLAELRGYFDPSLAQGNPIKAIPGEGLNIPIWLLGSSGFSAQLAGELGLPFAFAAHFSPLNTRGALQIYRKAFKPSNVLDKPYAMVALNIIAAETDKEAKRLFTTIQQQFLNLMSGSLTPLQPPVDDISEVVSSYQLKALEQQLGSSIVGSQQTIKDKLHTFLEENQVDEIMAIAQVFDHKARLRSYEILAEITKSEM